MPTYEYECKKCGKISEAFQSITDTPLKKCAECGGHLKRLIGTGGGIIFKGSGFYATDYRSSDYKKKAQAESDKKESAPCGADAPCPVRSKSPEATAAPSVRTSNGACAASCGAKKTD